MKTVDPMVSAVARLLGSRGGKSKSSKKIRAIRQNLRKAQAKRWPKPKARAA